MALRTNVDGFQEERYFERSWAIITQESSWLSTIGKLLLMVCIPVAGIIAVFGFMAEHARQIAWGQNNAPSLSWGDFGKYFKSGARSLGVLLGWGLLVSFVTNLIFSIPPFSWLPSTASEIVSSVVSTLVVVAVVRAAIYQQLTAGYEGRLLWEMIDNDFVGLARIMGIRLIASLVSAWVLRIITGVSFGFTSLTAVVASQSFGLNWSLPYTLFALLVLIILLAFAVMADLIVYTAVGLWYRQYNVPAWGRSSDPLPERVAPTKVEYGFAPAHNFDPQTGEPLHPGLEQTSLPEQSAVPERAPASEQAPTPEQALVPEQLSVDELQDQQQDQ